jgi:hypothetical protein
LKITTRYAKAGGLFFGRKSRKKILNIEQGILNNEVELVAIHLFFVPLVAS